MSKLCRTKDENMIVRDYDPTHLCHICVDEDGELRRVDLNIDSDEDDSRLHGKNAVGRRIKISGTQSYIEIAHSVEVLPEPDAVKGEHHE